MTQTKPKANLDQDTKIQKLEEQLRETEEKWKRALADYQNLERRVAQEKTHFVKLATAGLILNFISILDDLERACLHLHDKGLEMVIKQFKEILKGEGVKEIETEKMEFNPEQMECLEKAEGEENMVIGTIKKGYSINNTVLRPAGVVVGFGQSKKEDK